MRQCQKSFTLTVMPNNSKLSAYWAFEETSVQYVDKVAGYDLQPGGPFWTGGLDTVTGKILKGARIQEQGGTVNQQSISLPVVPPGFPHTALAFPTASIQGYSIFGWVNYSETIGHQPTIEARSFSTIYVNGFDFSITTNDDTTLNFVFTRYLLGNPNQLVQVNTSALNTWTFFAAAWDKAAQTMKLWVNGTLVATLGSVSGPASDFWFQTFIMSFGNSASDLMILDECGITSGPGLTQAQVTALYNSGNGVTWPQVSTIV